MSNTSQRIHQELGQRKTVSMQLRWWIVIALVLVTLGILIGRWSAKPAADRAARFSSASVAGLVQPAAYQMPSDADFDQALNDAVDRAAERTDRRLGLTSARSAPTCTPAELLDALRQVERYLAADRYVDGMDAPAAERARRARDLTYVRAVLHRCEGRT